MIDSNKKAFSLISIIFVIISIVFNCKDQNNPCICVQNVINISAIQGVFAPVLGGTPVTAITETEQYTGFVSWSPNDTIFAPDTAYTATVTLTAKSGYTLQGVSANFFTIIDAATVSNSANSGVVTAVFPATDIPPITISAIRGVTIPMAMAIGSSVITLTAQFKGSINWEPALTRGKFDPNTSYRARITLVPNEGFTLNGVHENFFTVEGATFVTNEANSGIINVYFPTTGGTTVNIDSITGIFPIYWANPVREIWFPQYKILISWSPYPGPGGVFELGIAYTALITFEPIEGITIQVSPSVAVEGAVSVSTVLNDITATFAVTQ